MTLTNRVWHGYVRLPVISTVRITVITRWQTGPREKLVPLSTLSIKAVSLSTKMDLFRTDTWAPELTRLCFPYKVKKWWVWLVIAGLSANTGTKIGLHDTRLFGAYLDYILYCSGPTAHKVCAALDKNSSWQQSHQDVLFKSFQINFARNARGMKFCTKTVLPIL